MHKLLVVVFAAGLISGCKSTKVASINSGSSAQAASMNTSVSSNSLTPQEAQDGWHLLFDGATTNGWHTYGYDAVNKGLSLIHI